MRYSFFSLVATAAASLLLVGVAASTAHAQDVPQLSSVMTDLQATATFLQDPLVLPAAVSDLDDQTMQSPGQNNPPPPPPSQPKHEGIGIGVKGGFLFSSLGKSPLNGDPLSRAAICDG